MRRDWGKSFTIDTVKRFLDGPQSRGFELARLFRISSEFFKGFRALHFLGPCITVFGSARFKEDHKYYQLAQTVGRLLSEANYNVMTGGGPGIMEAANRGAKQGNALSIGCNIKLPQEQHPNPYLDKWITFQYFFIRKVMLVKYSHAFIALPGGYGTMDEIFETATLVQTEKIFNFPIILIGKDYWNPLLDFLDKSLLQEKTISKSDFKLLSVTDSAEEAVELTLNKIKTVSFPKK